MSETIDPSSVTELTEKTPKNPQSKQDPRGRRKNKNNLAKGFLKKQSGKTVSLYELQAGFKAHTEKVKESNARRAKYAPTKKAQ